MVLASSTKASTLIRPTTDAPAPIDKISVVTSEKADKVCHVCSKQIVDRVQLSTQCVSTAANSSTPKLSPDSAGNHFVCNICLDGCQDPVVTHCGHLFCWPCLFCWLSQQSGLSQLRCPVCTANVQDKIIPLYDHGHGRKADHPLDSEATMRLFPDKQIPCRPLPSRLSDLPPVIGSATETTDYYAGRDADLNGSGDDQRIYAHTQGHTAERMQYHSNVYNARGADQFPTPRRRRRFSSDKEFVLHWAFICMASIATVCFVIAC